MNNSFNEIKDKLTNKPRTWLVTGVAGFIGSNLLEYLLKLGQKVIGLDNFATGYRSNLENVYLNVGEHAWNRFKFIQGDITNLSDCISACEGANIVLHQAALGSVPRSIENPIITNNTNINGFLNMLVAARETGVNRFVYASSSSVYGDHPALPKVEDRIGKPLSPYAVTKYVNEVYAHVFARTYGMECIGLRYFNVFGPRQDPDGAYAAVIPKWLGLMLRNEQCTIYGDGNTNRDFCYIDNVIQINLLAAVSENKEAVNQVYNAAFGGRTTLNQLYYMIRDKLARIKSDLSNLEPLYGPPRPGDVRHSQADISKAENLLGFVPTHSLGQGLDASLLWYVDYLK